MRTTADSSTRARRLLPICLLLCIACSEGSSETVDDALPASSGGTSSGGTPGTGGTATGGTGAGGQSPLVSSGGDSPITGGGPNPGDGGASGGRSGGDNGGGSGGINSGGSNDGTGGEPDGASTGGAVLSSGGSGSSGGAVSGTFIPDPSWACGSQEGIVDPLRGELVFRASVDIGPLRDVGQTPYGQRRFTDLRGGTTEGDLSASILEGGLDFELTLENGTVELEQVMMLRAQDGTLIYLRTCGLGPDTSTVRFVPDFEVGNQSSLAWLNTGTFVGTRSLDETSQTMELAVYDVSMVSGDDQEVQWEDPANVPHQPWDCLELSGAQGAEVFTEEVGIGASLSVGESKRGTRNVIPITGGTVSGRFSGAVVSAGADFQLLGGATTLDARYVLESDDGEFVIVRNCGPFGALVPSFEARVESPYAFLNENQFLSSDPGSAAGGVRITFYEIQ